MAKSLLRLGYAAAVLTGLASAPSFATTSQGTLIAVFGNVVTNGLVLNDPSLGQTTFLDNAASAFAAINNSTNPATSGTPPLQSTGSALIWGDTNGGAGQSSILDFFGAPLSSRVDQNFLLGRLTYSNGTSTLGSLIFGATISFHDGSVSPQTFLGTDTITIATTSNLGQSTAQDSDYINICGNQSNICQSSINAVETSQGGTGVTVDLYGTIVGDPQLFINSVVLESGQSSVTNGFIGTDTPVDSLPEPDSTMVLGSALAALAIVRTARRSVRPRPQPARG